MLHLTKIKSVMAWIAAASFVVAASLHPENCNGFNLGPVIYRPRPVVKFEGVTIRLTFAPDRCAVSAVTVNRGRNRARLVKWSNFGCRLHAFDASGKAIGTLGWLRTSRVFLLGAGKSTTHKFLLRRLAGFKRVGVYYFYATRCVFTGRPPARAGTPLGEYAYLRSPIVELKFRIGRAPIWRVVAALPQPGKVRSVAKVRPALLPPHQIPVTGPIAAFATFVKAVESGDAKAAERLCYQGHAALPPLYAANAAEAIAMVNLSRLLASKFGFNPEKRLAMLGPSPKLFRNSLRAMDFSSLRISGDRATVRQWVFYRGHWEHFPHFKICFRKIRGHWLIDSMATYSHLLSPAAYKLNIINAQKRTRIYDKLASDVAAGRFKTIGDFNADAANLFAAESHWFMERSISISARVRNHARVTPPVGHGAPKWAIDEYGVKLSLVPGPGTSVVATVRNNGFRTVSLSRNFPAWLVSVFGANGYPLVMRQKYGARWDAGAQQPPKPGVPLPPGGTVRKQIDLGRRYRLPAAGKIYICVSRRFGIRGLGGECRSRILTLTVRRGEPPRWGKAQAFPSVKPAEVSGLKIPGGGAPALTAFRTLDSRKTNLPTSRWHCPALPTPPADGTMQALNDAIRCVPRSRRP